MPRAHTPSALPLSGGLGRRGAWPLTSTASCHQAGSSPGKLVQQQLLLLLVPPLFSRLLLPLLHI